MLIKREHFLTLTEIEAAPLIVKNRITGMCSPMVIWAQQYKIFYLILAASAQPANVMTFADICIEAISWTPFTDLTLAIVHIP